MDRFLTLFSRFHVSAAMVLATVGYLAVPGNAFADDPKQCATDCENRYGAGNSSYWSCVAGCCNTDDPDDPNCCGLLCDDKDPDCIGSCNVLLNVVLLCPGDAKCDNTKNKNTPCTTRDYKGGGCSGGGYTCSQNLDECMQCSCAGNDGTQKCTCK